MLFIALETAFFIVLVGVVCLGTVLLKQRDQIAADVCHVAHSREEDLIGDLFKETHRLIIQLSRVSDLGERVHDPFPVDRPVEGKCMQVLDPVYVMYVQ